MSILSKKKQSIFILLSLLILVISACLKDDFDKIADSTWSPELAFPLVNSTLTSYNIFLQDGVPPQFDPDLNGLVRLVYDSDNFSRRASELIQLPAPQGTQVFSLNASSVQEFNSTTTSGATVVDSSTFTFAYSLDNWLGAASRIDTVYLKQGTLSFNVSSTLAQNVQVRIEIPRLFIQNQSFLQVIQFDSQGNTPEPIQDIRDLQNAYLIPGNSESIDVRVKIFVERSSPGNIVGQSAVNLNYAFGNCSFSSLHGNFGSFQMPIITNDSIHLGIFRNAITATNLLFQNAEALVRVQNSAGIPLNYMMQSFKGIRQGSTIPLVDISAYTFPATIPAQASFSALPGSADFSFNGSNSNFPTIINYLPKHMLVSGSHAFAATNVTNGALKDTSRVRIYSKVVLPLEGLTLDLQFRDTLDFNFKDITKEIEEILIRLNVDNGFPSDALLQVYFGRQNESTPHGPVVIVDSLYTVGNLPVMSSAQINADGEAISSTKVITDAIISGNKWNKLRNNQCNRIVLKARLTTNDLAQVVIKVFDDDKLVVRIGARVKVKKAL